MTEEILSAVDGQLFAVWFLIGAALVFWMQAGFAMVETGFTRAKNAGNILMLFHQCSFAGSGESGDHHQYSLILHLLHCPLFHLPATTPVLFPQSSRVKVQTARSDCSP